MRKTSDIARRRELARDAADDNYRRRRSDLVQAACRVFKRKGYRAARLCDIAEEAGIDRASLYYYAAGKEEFLQEVVEQASVEIVAMSEEILAGEGTAPEKLAAFIDRLMRAYEAHNPYLSVYAQENMAHYADVKSPWGRKMQALERRFDKAVIAIVQQGLDEGSIKPDRGEARLIAFGVIGMCAWSHRWYSPHRGYGAKTVSDSFSAIVLRGLAG